MNDANNNTIFITKSKINKINKAEIIKNIPSTATEKENPQLSNTNTEWRWRIFKLPDRQNEFIEISYKKPMQQRMFINNVGQWIQQEDMSNELDKYIIKQYYNYTP
jgi:hypothetical protein